MTIKNEFSETITRSTVSNLTVYSVTNNLRSGDHLPIDGQQLVQSADVKKVIGCHYDDCRPTIGRHSADFLMLILQKKLGDGAEDRLTPNQ